MDMLQTLSVQRMQLSEDPDDWCWVRWYWCQPGALPYPHLHAYGAPIWDTDYLEEQTGPRIWLDGGRYSRSQVSPYPGEHYHGLSDWFLDGPPDYARVPAENGKICGGEAWDTTVSVPVLFQVLQPIAGPVLYGEGGQVEGGEARIIYHYVWTADGGQVEGGIAPTGRGYILYGDGGQVEGGEAHNTQHYGWFAYGGQVEGGEAYIYSAYTFYADGGQLEGGQAGTGTGYQFRADGGQVEGGMAEIMSGYAWAGDGGQQEGGEAATGRGYIFRGDGGQQEGGEAAYSAGYLQRGEGGMAEGGEANSWQSYRWTADGGTVEGGTAATGSAYLFTADGGSVEGGEVTDVLASFGMLAEGGQVEGGEAIARAGAGMFAEGGQVEGGEAEITFNLEGDEVITGAILPFAGLEPPEGYLVCDGHAVGRAAQSKLFAVIGTTYGAGDGVSSFNLPDLRARVPLGIEGALNQSLGGTGGSASVTLMPNNLPPHHHSINIANNAGNVGNNYACGGQNAPVGTATTSDVGAAQPFYTLPPYLAIQWIIKT